MPASLCTITPELPECLTVRALLASYTRDHPVITASMVALALAFPIQSVLLPVFIGRLTRDIVNKEPSSKVVQNLKVLALLNAVAIALYTIDMVSSQAFSVSMNGHIQRQLTKYLVTEKVIGTDAVASTEMTVRMRVFASVMGKRINLLRNSYLPSVISIAFQALYLATKVDGGLGAIVASILVAIVVMTCYVTAHDDARSNASVRADEAAVSRVADILTNFTTVVGNSRAADEIADMGDLHYEAQQKRLQAAVHALPYSAAMIVYVAVAVSVYFWRVYTRFLSPAADKRSTAETVNIVATSSTMVLETLGVSISLSHSFYELIYGTASLTVVRGAFAAIAAETCALQRASAAAKCNTLGVADAAVAAAAAAAQPAVRIDNVTFDYRACAAAPLYSGFSLTIEAGRNTAIVGPNGTGKSSLMKLVTRYTVPLEGELYLYGVPYSKLSIADLRRRVAYAAQAPTLFNRELWRNIGYARPCATRADVVAFVASIGLTDYFNTFDCGLDTVAGREGKAVSGGQRQMVQLARILFQGADVIVLDEITAAVDVVNKQIIVNLIATQFSSATLIFVTHDPDLLSLADVTVQFDVP
jgi:ABC-type multidrug transport system fused ATPase/permease subunit